MPAPAKITEEQLLQECKEHGTDKDAIALIADKYGMTKASVKAKIYALNITERLIKKTVSEEPVIKTRLLKPITLQGKKLRYELKDKNIIMGKPDVQNGSIVVSFDDVPDVIAELQEMEEMRANDEA